ncbi:hypothetical protein PGT21_005745 [Puccinia graminis f. sp. tritici]|uniref:Uncharacterized protein n=1 Tax=Puccinia graminis f. sp. tritici TaxID=56615 RepID=A0A5B0ML80_PUCGR|nr:hypothetical protein PGT21_005745 [Puccinia graminis f. sp. tritici]
MATLKVYHNALDVVLGTIKKPKLEDPEKPTKEALAYEEINRIAYIEIIEHLDNNHLAYISQILVDETSFCGFSVWQILKKKYAGDDYVAKDLALEKFLDLDYHGSITDFIFEVRLSSALAAQAIPSPGMMLNRLERHAAQNHLDRSSSMPSQQALLTTDDKFYMCPHCKKGFTICSHCDKAGHREAICFEKHPDQRPSKTSNPSAPSKSKPVAQAHLAISSPTSHAVHGFTAEQIKSERNFQAMLANPEFKKLNINAEYRL